MQGYIMFFSENTQLHKVYCSKLVYTVNVYKKIKSYPSFFEEVDKVMVKFM